MFLFKNDRYCPYTVSVLLTIIITLFFCFFNVKLPIDTDIKSLANIVITITSIFMSFLWVWLTLLHQSKDNKNVEMLKKNNKYNLFLWYFKQSLFVSIITIIYSIFISLWIQINVYTFILLLTLIFLVIMLNYRIIYFLFKVLEE